MTIHHEGAVFKAGAQILDRHAFFESLWRDPVGFAQLSIAEVRGAKPDSAAAAQDLTVAVSAGLTARLWRAGSGPATDLVWGDSTRSECVSPPLVDPKRFLPGLSRYNLLLDRKGRPVSFAGLHDEVGGLGWLACALITVAQECAFGHSEGFLMAHCCCSLLPSTYQNTPPPPPLRNRRLGTTAFACPLQSLSLNVYEPEGNGERPYRFIVVTEERWHRRWVGGARRLCHATTIEVAPGKGRSAVPQVLGAAGSAVLLLGFRDCRSDPRRVGRTLSREALLAVVARAAAPGVPSVDSLSSFTELAAGFDHLGKAAF